MKKTVFAWITFLNLFAAFSYADTAQFDRELRAYLTAYHDPDLTLEMQRDLDAIAQDLAIRMIKTPTEVYNRTLIGLESLYHASPLDRKALEQLYATLLLLDAEREVSEPENSVIFSAIKATGSTLIALYAIESGKAFLKTPSALTFGSRLLEALKATSIMFARTQKRKKFAMIALGVGSSTAMTQLLYRHWMTKRLRLKEIHNDLQKQIFHESMDKLIVLLKQNPVPLEQIQAIQLEIDQLLELAPHLRGFLNQERLRLLETPTLN